MTKKILLVENDDFYIEVIGTFVKLFMQHKLEVVKNPQEALEQVRKDSPHLIPLDLESNGQEALDFAESMRDDSDSKRIPILALSQNEARQDDALGRGCAAFLTKPFKVRGLEAAIEQHLNID